MIPLVACPVNNQIPVPKCVGCFVPSRRPMPLHKPRRIEDVREARKVALRACICTLGFSGALATERRDGADKRPEVTKKCAQRHGIPAVWDTTIGFLRHTASVIQGNPFLVMAKRSCWEASAMPFQERLTTVDPLDEFPTSYKIMRYLSKQNRLPSPSDTRLCDLNHW